MRGILIALGALLVIALLGVGAYFVQWLTAEPRGRLDAREQTVADGDFRLAAYDLFFSQCAAVQAQEGRLASLETELETDPPSGRVTQIQASLTAVRAQRIELIRRYNADATRDYTVGQFRDADLPYQLDPTDEETQCAL